MINRPVTIAFIIFATLALCARVSQSHAFFGFGSKQDNSLTTFVPAQSIDQSSVIVAQSAITRLTQNNNTSPSSEYNAATLIEYNIIQAVENSKDRNQTITNHIAHLQQSSSYHQSQLNNYQSQLNQEQNKLAECTNSKKLADNEVIQTINTDKLENLNMLLQRSIELGKCEAEHRIKSNTFSLVIQRQNHIIGLLNKKASILEQYKPQIIQYPELILDPNLAKELSQIASQF